MLMAKEIYELTNPQKSIWHTEKYFEGTTINNICASITILDKFDVDALKQAIYHIVEKNDSFRTRIIIQDNKPMQYFAEFEPFPVEIIQLKTDQEINKIKEELMNYSYNIIDSNLFCFKIAKFPDGHGILIFTVHHIISDGWSLGIFAQNIMKEYCELCGVEVPPSQETGSYIEYIHSEKEYLQSSKFEKDKNYWIDQFQEIPESVSFAGSKNTFKNNNYSSKRESFRVSSFVAQNIQDYCSQNKISVFQFFMAIYSIYLSKTTGLNEFVIRNSNS